MTEPSKALALCQAQIRAGKTKRWIGEQIGYSRTAVSLYMAGKYGSDPAEIEAQIIARFDRRICPHDQQEKLPEQCQRVAMRGPMHGFPDAEMLWQACQTCPHKPTGGSK